jgi:hypothetical protein
MWRAVFVGAILAVGCGRVADSSSDDGTGGAATSGNGGAATSSGGTRSWRDAGTVATGGTPLTPEEAACNDVFYDPLPANTDSGQCAFAVPAALSNLSRGISVTLTATDGLERYEPLLNFASDCVLNRDKGWYYNRSVTPQTVVLCPATCAAASSGEYRLTIGCDRGVGDPVM